MDSQSESSAAPGGTQRALDHCELTVIANSQTGQTAEVVDADIQKHGSYFIYCASDAK